MVMEDPPRALYIRQTERQLVVRCFKLTNSIVYDCTHDAHGDDASPPQGATHPADHKITVCVQLAKLHLNMH
jgi:hypothetical protein